MATTRNTLPVALALMTVLGWATPVRADGLRVAPIKLFLSTKEPNGMLTVRNESQSEQRYQVTVFSWGESASGEMELNPTKDVAFFPALFSLKPNEERNIRVGTTAKVTDKEKTYRIFVEELPQGKTSQGVRLLTRMGMPIFVQPEKHDANPVLDGPTIAGGKLTFKVKNAGAGHLEFTGAKAHGLGADGASVYEHEWKGWYLLAGNERVFTVDVPADACGKAAKFEITFDYEKTSLKGAAPVSAASCTAAPKNGG